MATANKILKHTEGPWSVREEKVRGRIEVKGPQGYGTIACAYKDGFTPSLAGITGTPEGNAALIASAPELLSVLKKSLDFLEATEMTTFGLKAEIRAAVAKAEGVSK